MFQNIRITQRMGLVVVAFWLALLSVSTVSYWGMFSSRNSIREVHDKRELP